MREVECIRDIDLGGFNRTVEVKEGGSRMLPSALAWAPCGDGVPFTETGTGAGWETMTASICQVKFEGI